MTTLEQLNLTAQQKELVAVGASIGAGCHPCVSHHFKAAAKAGLDDEQLLAAVACAERVTAEAAVLMADHVRSKLDSDLTPNLLSDVEETLASLGAALGANDKTGIRNALQAAAKLGVTQQQLHETIEAARVVQEHAAAIHVREAKRLLDPLDTAAAEPTDASCGCGAATDEPAPATVNAPKGAPEGSNEGCSSKGFAVNH